MDHCWLTLPEQGPLDGLDASATPGFEGDKSDAKAATRAMREQLADLQHRLFAEGRQSLLIVLQAMDTGGKDGLIRRVFTGVNPNGVDVARFGRPSAEELSHDYLWRVHRHAPARGMITIFNRSHYEDVLVVRVNELVAEPVWSQRFDHIRAFERLLADEGCRILKFCLHIDRDEQRERLQARLDDPDKRWKFDQHDIEQRRHWDDYMLAYAEAIRRTDTPWAPWFVIPANRKWFRDYAVMRILVGTLREMDPQYPPADGFDPSDIHFD
ncbi:MAG: polyphosphate kinase 2 family protein [Burkholderiaceae bacterium]